MALEASTLSIVVQSQGVQEATKALSDLAAAGEKAEKSTSNIGSGAQASAKTQVDAAQQAVASYNNLASSIQGVNGMQDQSAAMLAKIQSQVEKMDYSRWIDSGKQAAAIQKQIESVDYTKWIEQGKQAAAAQKQIEKIDYSNWIASSKQALAVQKQLEQIDYSKWVASGKQALATQKQIEQADYDAWVQRGKNQKQAEEFIASLKKQADTVGMTAKEMRDYNAELLKTRAAQLGVSGQADEYINKLKGAKGAHEGLSLATAGTSREFLVLTHELATGQLNRFYGSLLVLGERMNVMPPIWKALGDAAAKVGLGFGTALLSIIAVGIALGTAIVTYIKSATALKELNNEVILTGHSAGATGEALYTMANRIGSAYGEFTKAREAVQALTATGKFTVDQINMIADAAVGLERYAGVSIEKTAAAFEKLAGNPLKITDKGFKDVSNAAMQLDEQMHFLEPTVLAHIMQLERQGEHAQASRIAIKALADEEKARVDELEARLTPFGSFLDEMGKKASNFWNNLFHKGSLDDQLKETQEHMQRLMSFGHGDEDWAVRGDKKKIAEIQNQIIQNEYDEAEKSHKRTLDRLTNEQQVYMRNLLERSKGEENLQQRLSRFDNLIAQQRERAKNDPAYAAQMQSMLSDANVSMMRDQVKRDSIRGVGAKPKSDGLSGLDQHLAEANARYEIDKRYYDDQLKFINDLQQKHLISDSAADNAKKEFLENQSKLEADSLAIQMKMVDDFHSKDVKLMEQAAAKKAEIQKRIDKNRLDTALRQNMAATDPAAREQKEQDDANTKAVQAIGQINAQTQAIQAKIDAYNRIPEAARAAITNEKQMQDEITKSEIDWKQAQIDAISASGEASADQIIRLTAEKKALEERAKAQGDWEAIQAKITANAGRSSALTKVATEQIRMWKDVGSEISKSFTQAFGSAGDAAGKMFKAFAEGQADAISLQDKARVISENKSLSEAEKAKQLDVIQMQAGQNQIGMYGDMAGAAAGFFDKQSKGYQIAMSVSKAFHLAEMALALASIPAKLAAGAATMFAQSGWGGFAGVAAMTAAVAAFGVAVSGGGSGPMSAADQQKIQGTGTVLGSPTITDGTKVILAGEKSNSIANSLKDLEKTSGLGLAVQNSMLTAMTALNNNISSLAKSIVTNGGLTGTYASDSITGIAASFGGTIGKILGGTIGGFASKVATAIFGGKVSVDDVGLKVNSASLAQIASQGVSASQYTNTTKSGGWFSSDKHNTSLSSLDSNTTDQFTKVILSMSDTLKQAAGMLGVSGDAFNQKLQSFVVNIGNVSLKGMTGDQIQSTLQNIFSKLGDQMAQYAFADLAKYQKIGEGLLQTVSRVASDLMMVNDVFKVLGRTMPVAAQGIAQAEKLVDSFGSSDALTKAVKSYEDAIYTDNEKLAPVISSVQDALKGMGLSSIKTKEDFKKVVDSLDLTSDSGVALFNKLMTLAPTFGTAIDGLSKVNDKTKDSITGVIDKLKQFGDNIRKFRDGLVLSANSPLTPAQKLEAAASQFATTIAKAKAGDVTAQGNVTDIAQSYLDAARTMFASGDAYTNIFNKVQAQLAGVQDFADKGVSDAQKQLDAMGDQLTSLNTLNGTATDILNSLNNLVNGTSPATTATSPSSDNKELLSTLKTLVGTIQESDANNSAGLNNVAGAAYDGQQTAAERISDGLETVVTLLKGSGIYKINKR